MDQICDQLQTATFKKDEQIITQVNNNNSYIL